MDILSPLSYIVDDLISNETKRYGSRDLSMIDGIVIHCSGTKNGRAASYARYHVKNLQWPGIGYHIVIDADGLHQTQDLTTISYHLSGQNLTKVGICQTGNFDKIAPTDEQYWAWMQGVIHVDMMLGRRVPVSFHNDYTDQKTCPGLLFDKHYFLTNLKDMRRVL